MRFIKKKKFRESYINGKPDFLSFIGVQVYEF